MDYGIRYTNTHAKKTYTFSVINRFIKYPVRHSEQTDSVYPISYNPLRRFYRFGYGNVSSVSEYRFAYATAYLRYGFQYKHVIGRGIYRFKYNEYDEIYYENPLISFMYPEHTGLAESLTLSLMYPEHIGFIKILNEGLTLINRERTGKDYINYLALSSIAHQALYASGYVLDVFKINELEYEGINHVLKGDEYEVAEVTEGFSLSTYREPSINKLKTSILTETDENTAYISANYIVSAFASFLKAVVTAEKSASFLDLRSAFYDSLKLLLPEYEGKITDIIKELLFTFDYKQAFNSKGVMLGKNKDITELIVTATYGFEEMKSKKADYIKSGIFRLNKKITESQRNLSNHSFDAIKNIEVSFLLNDKIFRSDIKEFFKDSLLTAFIKAFKEALRDNILVKTDKADKLGVLYNPSSNAEMQKEILNNFYDYLSEKDCKPAHKYMPSIAVEKGMHVTKEENPDDALNRNTKRNADFTELSKILDSSIFKKAVTELLVRFTETNEESNHDSVIFTDLIKLLEKEAEREIDTEYEAAANFEDTRNAVIIYLSLYAELSREHGVELEAVMELLSKTCAAYIDKSIITGTEATAISILNSYMAACEIKNVNLQNEHELALWQRFWFLYAGGIYDKKMLPCHDFPYEDEPIEFNGFDDLIPNNRQVVYPEAFWLGVDHHPVPEGKELGLDEMPLALNIMVDIINILILMWHRFYPAFWGWTGTQAVLGITSEVYKWLTLTASRNEQDKKGSRAHYDRCYRWLRWEAEKVSLAARNDMELRGNYYVGILLEEMIFYIQDHHFDVMPIFEDVNKMDEWRQSFNRDLQNDITWVLDKVKGIRHKLIIGREQKGNA